MLKRRRKLRLTRTIQSTSTHWLWQTEDVNVGFLAEAEGEKREKRTMAELAVFFQSVSLGGEVGVVSLKRCQQHLCKIYD